LKTFITSVSGGEITSDGGAPATTARDSDARFGVRADIRSLPTNSRCAHFVQWILELAPKTGIGAESRTVVLRRG